MPWKAPIIRPWLVSHVQALLHPHLEVSQRSHVYVSQTIKSFLLGSVQLAFPASISLIRLCGDLGVSNVLLESTALTLAEFVVCFATLANSREVLPQVQSHYV